MFTASNRLIHQAKQQIVLIHLKQQKAQILQILQMQQKQPKIQRNPLTAHRQMKIQMQVKMLIQKQPKQLNNKKVRYHLLYLGDNGLFNL